MTEQGSSTIGWYYNEQRNGVCLTGGLNRKVGDSFRINILSDESGFQ
jgi:hypothetical protein